MAFLEKWYFRAGLYVILGFVLGYLLTTALVVMFLVGGSSNPPMSSPLGTLVFVFTYFGIPILIIVFAVIGEVAYHFTKHSK